MPGWDIDVVVEVDCQHSPDHGLMHTVFEQARSASSVDDAIAAFASAVEMLEDLAQQPLKRVGGEGRALIAECPANRRFALRGLNLGF